MDYQILWLTWKTFMINTIWYLTRENICLRIGRLYEFKIVLKWCSQRFPRLFRYTWLFCGIDIIPSSILSSCQQLVVMIEILHPNLQTITKSNKSNIALSTIKLYMKTLWRSSAIDGGFRELFRCSGYYGNPCIDMSSFESFSDVVTYIQKRNLWLTLHTTLLSTCSSLVLHFLNLQLAVMVSPINR